MCLCRGVAGRVVITDFPDAFLLANIRHNAERNFPADKVRESDNATTRQSPSGNRSDLSELLPPHIHDVVCVTHMVTQSMSVSWSACVCTPTRPAPCCAACRLPA